MRENISGRSMIEMLAVLVLVGLVGIGALHAYTKAMERYHINATINDITQIVTNTRYAFGQLDSRGYGSMDFNVKSMQDKNYTNRKVADKLGIFPEHIRRNDYLNSYNGKIQYFPDGMYKNDDGKAFLVEFYGIPREACIEIVTKDWNSNLGLIAMKVKSSADGYPVQAGALVGKCKTQYKKGVGMFCAADFPISVEKAATVCDYAKNNDISWKFY